jgi:DNA-binding SARP family transcriptional activator
MPDGFAKTGYWIQQAQRLILAPDGLTRDALAEQLYLQQRTSRTAISVLVNRLHKAIGQDGPWAACGGLIGSQQGRYRLNPQLAIRTDLDEFQAAWQTGGQPAGDEARLNAYRRLVTPYGGPLFEACHDQGWVLVAHQRTRQQWQEAHRWLHARLRDQGDLPGALTLAEAHLAVDGADSIAADEEAHRRKITILLATGRTDEARRQTDAMAQCLADRHGRPPSEETRRLLSRLLQT